MKDVLLEIAIRHFGRAGFDGAATRAIATEADTAMSSITYHFGGKEGLYLACADHIAAGMLDRIGPILHHLENTEFADREAATEALCMILTGFAQMMLDPTTQDWASFVAREQQVPTEAFERLYDGAMARVIATVVRLIGLARPDLGDAEVRATAIALWGQAIMLRMARASVCRVMGVDDLDKTTADTLIQRFLANARCILLDTPEETP